MLNRVDAGIGRSKRCPTARRPCRRNLAGLFLVLMILDATLLADQTTPPKDSDSSAEKPILAQLREEAAALRPLVDTDLAHRFLNAVGDLPAIDEKRVVFWESERRRALTPNQARSLPRGELKSFTERELDGRFYYYTAYGTPLAYVRAIDLASRAGWQSADGQRVLDFGFGGIGHLRLLASLGSDAVGVEVLDLLRAYYRKRGDTGKIPRAECAGPGSPGRLTLLYGRFPAEDDLVKAVGEGYSLVISKNTLKKGYIHPERLTDPRYLVHLGVDDEEFVKAIYHILEPGGLFIIYNLYPPQNPPNKPYIPHATGECPFDRSLLEQTGFEILVLDRDDTTFARKMAEALGWKADFDLDELFAMYTILQRRRAEKP
jgi:SAM-dependent methyltransferase